MVYNLLLFGARTVGLLIGGIVFKDIVIAIGLYSFVGFLFFIFLATYSLKLAKVKFNMAFFYFFKVLLIILLPLTLLKLWL